MTIFAPSHIAVNFASTLANFGLGLFPAPAPQADNTLPRMPYTSADLAEWTAESIARTVHEEMVAGIMDRIVAADHDDAMDELAARRLADLRYECMA